MSVKIYVGDCIQSMEKIDEKSINCCITSPPYYGLRDYGVSGQIGLETTPENYIEKIVDVFREVKRVLRDDGTVWLNIGDSYYNYRPGKGQAMTKQTLSKTNQDLPQICAKRGNKLDGLKQKDLIGIPWMLAFALRDDGWYLRQDIIWSKPNPMPESVTDRCTKAHEYIFLLSKSQSYYYDRMAIAEPAIYAEQHANKATSWGKKKKDAGVKANIEQYQQMGIENNKTCLEGGMRNKRSVWSVNLKPYKGAHFATFPPALIDPCVLAGCPQEGTIIDPFGGAGTTGLVAIKHNRKAILCELNPEYAQLAYDRIKNDSPIFSNVEIL